MDISKLQVNVKPRNPWQAVDLGITLTRQWAGSMYLGWLVMSLPFYLLLQLSDTVAPYSPFILWWFKPLFERVLLIDVSHRMFAQALTLKQRIRMAISGMHRLLLPCLITYRLNLSRSYVMPIIQLEGLTGARRRQRNTLFYGGNKRAATWLTLVLLHIETALVMAAYSLIYLFVPEGIDYVPVDLDTVQRVDYLSNMLVYLAIGAVAPFYVGAGFSLYLNRRIALEGWDIEVGFRRLAQRVSSQGKGAVTALLLVCFGMFGLGAPTPAQASEDDAQNTAQEVLYYDRDEAKQAAKKVLEGEAFNQEVVQSYPEFFLDMELEQSESVEPVDVPDWLAALLNFLANSIEVILWSLLGLAIFLLVWHYRDWISESLGRSSESNEPAAQPPNQLFGLQVSSDSLPEDPAAEARRLVEQQHIREALSLLYRASLNYMLERASLRFKAGYTELECVALVRKETPQEVSEYFAELTRAWRFLAYGDIAPDAERMHGLLEQWPLIFTEVAND